MKKYVNILDLALPYLYGLLDLDYIYIYGDRLWDLKKF